MIVELVEFTVKIVYALTLYALLYNIYETVTSPLCLYLLLMITVDASWVLVTCITVIFNITFVRYSA